MSYNGSGSFVINSTGQPVVAATLIDATVFNALTADVGTGLSTAICKDGQTTVTADIPFNNKKLTGVAAATARTDAASLATIQDGTGVYVATVAGTADVITLTASPAITAYVAGQTFRFIASGANTTNVTVAINGLAAKAITKNGTVALIAGDIASASMTEITYDGTRFILGTVVSTQSLQLTGGTMTGTLTSPGITMTGTLTSPSITMTGGINEKLSTVASAATPDIFALTIGNTIDYTGTATATGFVASPAAGAQRTLVCAGAAVFTAGANMLIDGLVSGQNYTAAAGDKVYVIAVTTTQFRLTVAKKNGQAVGTPIAQFGKAIYGLTYDNGTDATNDLNINTGGAMDATGAYWMTLATALGKQSDVAWAVGGTTGTPVGGLDTGAVGNSDYYIWLIARSDTGVVDALYSLSSTAPTMPTNYDFKRLMGWFKRVGGTIVLFHSYETEGGGLHVTWDVPTLDINLAATLTTTRRTDAVKVPLNFSVVAELNVMFSDAVGANFIHVCSPDQTDAAPSTTAAPLANVGSCETNIANTPVLGRLRIRTSSAGLVAARGSVATIDNYRVVTVGFFWARRN